MNESLILRPQPGAQEQFLSTPADIAIYGGSAGSGKQIDINTLVPTPNGFNRMGELSVGDHVFSIDGSIATVIHAFPIQFTNEAYDVVFDSGEIITADGEHLWKTMDCNERAQVLRRTDEFREKRRLARPSRSKATKNYGSSKSITRFNQERKYQYLEVPEGSVRTTYDILETLKVRETRINHSVDVAKQIQLPHNDLLVDCYMLGCWLGDGQSAQGTIGCLVEDMDEMLTHIQSPILRVSIDSKGRNRPMKNVLFNGLTSYIRKDNLFKNKHIPTSYLRASIEQRIELLRGIMDTDGTCDKNGKCTIAFSNKKLTEDTQELLCSLGIKCTIHEKKIEGYKSSHIINFTPNFYVFHLTRKRDRQNDALRTVRAERRYIVDIRKSEPCFMRCIAIDHPSHLYLVGRTFIPTHNSYALLLEPIRHIHNPGFGGVIFRRESKELTMEGGLVSKAMGMYPYLGGVYRSQPTPSFTFPSGAKISFGHLNQEREVLAWMGSEICYEGFDEGNHFTDYQINYMLSRNRSTCGVRPYVRMTCNPDADSWLAEFLSWWIDQETGYPIKERGGVIRYLIRVDGQRIWGDSREELVEQYGCELLDAKSVTFIPATITDNPILLSKDPGYLANLKGLSFVEKSRLLDGNWKIRPAAGMYFPRYDTTIIDWVPTDVIKWVRSWDLAASEEQEGKYVDWTVGMKVGRRSNGKLVIADVVRVQRKAADVRALVRRIADMDGRETWIALPQDPGQSGKDQAQSYKEMLNGFVVLTRTITKNKLVMAEPAAALWQQRNIEIVRAKWNEDLLCELEAFPTPKIHDDQVDCLSAAVTRLPGHSVNDYTKTGLSAKFKEFRRHNRT